jgi:malyl-CoA/(S)-citramalyl-CoA lyase
MRNPRHLIQRPLAIGAPKPWTEIPVRPSRMIHFFDPSNPRMASKIPDIAKKVDILLANLEDAIEIKNKVAAREGLVKIANEVDFGATQFWTRVNSLDSPWFLDDMLSVIGEAGHKLDVVMIPKVEGPWDIHFVDQLLAQLEARHGLKKPLLVHAILETALGVANVEEIALASPRMQGMSLGPADLAASRRMKTTRVGGGHPGYLVREDPHPEQPDAPRAKAQQDLWHYTMARMVDACVSAGILPFYGPFGDIGDPIACEDQFRNAFLMGCVGAWSLHPSQIEIARRVFSPPPDEVSWARRVIEAMGDGSGTVMLEGKMQDDATVKQCRVMVGLAKLIARGDAEMAAAYGFTKKDLED